MYVPEAFVSYLVYNPILNINFCKRTTLSVFHDACTRRLASVGLAQARPNNHDDHINYVQLKCSWTNKFAV